MRNRPKCAQASTHILSHFNLETIHLRGTSLKSQFIKRKKINKNTHTHLYKDQNKHFFLRINTIVVILQRKVRK